MKYQNKFFRFLNECRFHNLTNLFIVLISILLTCLAIEAGTRIYNSKPLFEWIDYRYEAVTNTLPLQSHELLGWIPKPGSSVKHDLWKKEVHILNDGIRSNGNHIQYRNSRPILVTGDSFTFGSEVSDNETWPAYLEQLTGRRVINAGVGGYGLDQSFLRMKLLTPGYQPDTIIISLIPQDIIRCECSVFSGADKPYFIVANGSLHLMNTPLKGNKIKPVGDFRILGYSYFIHSFMSKYYHLFWYKNYMDAVHINNDGAKIACLLFKELETFANRNKVKNVYVLIQTTYVPSSSTQVDSSINCINKNRIQIIDLRNILSGIREHDESLYNSFFKGHMTPSGNQFVAEAIFRVMQEKREKD